MDDSLVSCCLHLFSLHIYFVIFFYYLQMPVGDILYSDCVIQVIVLYGEKCDKHKMTSEFHSIVPCI